LERTNLRFHSISKDYVLGQELIEEEKKIKFEDTDKEMPPVVPPEPAGDQDVMILVDCIHNQMYANKMCPILQQTVWDSKSNVHIAFNPVVYMSLNSEHISQIRVHLLDQNLREIRAKGFSTILRLHFKPRI